MNKLGRDEIESLVLACMQRLNEQREPGERLAIGPDAPIFSDSSPLDSMGLVTLMMDVEDALADQGLEVSLSDARAMSAKQSPYENVATLVDFVEQRQGVTGESSVATDE